jgi:hypothetical protein
MDVRNPTRRRHTKVCRGCWTSCTQSSEQPLRRQAKKSKKEGICERNGRRTERIYELLPVCAFEGDNFTASATDIGVDVERLPEMINRARARLCTDIEQDANIGLENGAKGVKEPTMGIDLLLVFLLETKDDLHGNNAFLRPFELVGRRNGDCGVCKLIR